MHQVSSLWGQYNVCHTCTGPLFPLRLLLRLPLWRVLLSWRKSFVNVSIFLSAFHFFTLSLETRMRPLFFLFRPSRFFSRFIWTRPELSIFRNHRFCSFRFKHFVTSPGFPHRVWCMNRADRETASSVTFPFPFVLSSFFGDNPSSFQ